MSAPIAHISFLIRLRRSRRARTLHRAGLTLMVLLSLLIASARPALAQQDEPSTRPKSDAACLKGAETVGGRAYGPGLASPAHMYAACLAAPPQEATSLPIDGEEEGALERQVAVAGNPVQPAEGSLGSLLYVYRENQGLATAFRNLLNNRGFEAAVLALSDVDATDLSAYDAIILAHDTGDAAEWPVQVRGFSSTAAYLEAAGVPIVGLGEGGYAYFGKVGSNIGWPRGWRRELRSVEPNELASDFWKTPYDFGTPPDPLELYTADNLEVGVYAIGLPDVLMLAREPDDDEHAPIAVQRKDCYTLWGFSAGPGQMTPAGKELFVNAVAYAIELECDPQILLDTLYLPAMQGN